MQFDGIHQNAMYHRVSQSREVLRSSATGASLSINCEWPSYTAGYLRSPGRIQIFASLPGAVFARDDAESLHLRQLSPEAGLLFPCIWLISNSTSRLICTDDVLDDSGPDV